MLAIKSKTSKSEAITPNLLPCRIHHDGKLEVSQRHWDPKTEQDGKQSVYFRGRRLLGKNVPVPEGHTGAVLKITSDKAQKSNDEAADEDEDETTEETFVAEEIATFDSIMVWNHETVPEASEDPYIKGMEEWMGMAEAIHST